MCAHACVCSSFGLVFPRVDYLSSYLYTSVFYRSLFSLSGRSLLLVWPALSRRALSRHPCPSTWLIRSLSCCLVCFSSRRHLLVLLSVPFVAEYFSPWFAGELPILPRGSSSSPYVLPSPLLPLVSFVLQVSVDPRASFSTFCPRRDPRRPILRYRGATFSFRESGHISLVISFFSLSSPRQREGSNFHFHCSRLEALLTAGRCGRFGRGARR